MDIANPQGASGSLETAAESFGSLLEAETSQETTEDVSEEVSEEVEEVEETEQPESEDESEDESDEEVIQDDAEEPEGESEAKFEKLSELAEALEMPEEDFLASIKTTVKVNGEEIEVNLADLKNGYQMESDYRQKTSALAEQRKAFEAEAQQKIQAIESKAQETLDITSLLETQLIEEYNSIDWSTIRADSPAEYAALQHDYQSRLASIQGMKEQAEQSAEFAKRQALEKQLETQQKVLQEESARLLEAIPEWQDSEKAKAGKSEVASYLKEYGFGDQELNNLFDHRSLVIARKAMLFDRMNKTADVSKKKVSKLPKIIKPGAKPGKDEVKSFKRSEQMKRLKKSNRVEDAASIFKEFLE